MFGVVLSILQLEQLGPALLDGHRQHEAVGLGSPGHLGSQLLVDEHAGPAYLKSGGAALLSPS